MRHGFQCGIMVGLALFLNACASGVSVVPGESALGLPEYVIGPGDSVNVFVYRVPELSVEVPVRPDGRISTPLVPDVLALDKTPSQLAKTLQDELKKYIKDPNVTIMVNGFVGPPNRQIRVIGEVAQPLAMPYRVQLSLLDVMIASKGLTRFAAGNRAVIVRQEPDGRKIYNVHLSDLLKDGDVSQNLPMQPGDTLFVPQAWF
jgi:polysaccharide biosynthesis/export protein